MAFGSVSCHLASDTECLFLLDLIIMDSACIYYNLCLFVAYLIVECFILKFNFLLNNNKTCIFKAIYRNIVHYSLSQPNVENTYFDYSQFIK